MMICEIVIGFAQRWLWSTSPGAVSHRPCRSSRCCWSSVSRGRFFAPASQSLAPNLVPARDLPNAIAWNSTSWQTATIVGPVAGGLLYGLGATVPYLTASFFFAAAIVAIALVPPPLQRARGEGQSWKTLVAGFSYVRNQKIVLGAISLDMFAVLLGGAIALMPVFARDVLELGPWGLGLLRASPGIGAIGMAIYLASRPIRRHAGRAMFIAVGVFGAATVVFGLSKSLPLTMVALIVMGASDMISVYVRQSLVQLWTPDESARPRQRRQHGLHRRLQRARRISRRRHGFVDRPDCCSGHRWRRNPCRGPCLEHRFPAAAADPVARP
jgi:MFS family permease